MLQITITLLHTFDVRENFALVKKPCILFMDTEINVNLRTYTLYTKYTCYSYKVCLKRNGRNGHAECMNCIARTDNIMPHTEFRLTHKCIYTRYTYAHMNEDFKHAKGFQEEPLQFTLHHKID